MTCGGCSKDCKCSFDECGDKCDCCTHCKCHRKVTHSCHPHCPRGHCHEQDDYNDEINEHIHTHGTSCH